jgi:hypothetical protein
VPPHPESVPPAGSGRGRRHDTFAVLGRAQAAVDRAHVVLDRAFERSIHSSSAPARRQAPPAPDAAALWLLRRRFDADPGPTDP